MREASKLWWLAAVVLGISWFLYDDALSDLKRYVKYQNSAGGLIESFFHGFVLDLAHVGRISEKAEKLADRAILWQNVFRFSMLATVVLGGAAAYYASQESKSVTSNSKSE